MPARSVSTSLHLKVTEQGHAGEARRLAAAWIQEQDVECGPEFAGAVALVVTELAKNLALHTTKGGILLLRRCSEVTGCAVRVLSLDCGPGVENFHKCLRDGYSTAGTAGIGLGGVRRMSQIFEAQSQAGVGTAVLAEVMANPGEAPSASTALVGVVSAAIRGETVCGDDWAEWHGAGASRYLIADGLGHGPIAAEAAEAACQVFRQKPELPLTELLRSMHEALRSSRGAAVAMAHVDHSTRQVKYAGVGNISGSIVRGPKVTHLVSQNGTVGAAFPARPTEFTYEIPADALLVMHSDGIKTNWQLERYLGLSARHPELIAGVLFRDFGRDTDDSTVLVARGGGVRI